MRKLLTSLLALFVWAQISVVLHDAEHGHLAHTHGGKLCEAYVFASTASDTAPAPASIITPAVWEHLSFHHADDAFISIAAVDFSARDPPHHS